MARHRGVGIVVVNEAKTRFYVQRKDDSYPNFPLHYSVFGGAREAGESPEQALRRELSEEWLPEAVALIGDNYQLVFAGTVPAPNPYEFHFYEAVVSDEQLDTLARLPVLEGEAGYVFERGALLDRPYIWHINEVLARYLRGNFDDWQDSSAH